MSLELEAKVDFSDIEKLRDRIILLDSALSGLRPDDADFGKLQDDLQASRQKMRELIETVNKTGEAFGGGKDGLKQHIYALMGASKDYSAEMIEQKNKISSLNEELKRLKEAYRSLPDGSAEQSKALRMQKAAALQVEKEKAHLAELSTSYQHTTLQVGYLNDKLKLFAEDGNSAEDVTKKIEGSIMSLGAKFIGGLGIKNFIGNIISTRNEFQNMENALNTMMGEKGAKKAMDDLKQLAKISPLTMQDMVGAEKMMIGFGLNADDTIGYIKAISDVSMGESGKFNSLTLAFSQMSAAGKLMGQDLNQMINAGFNPLSQISITTGKSIGQLKEEMGKGAISAQMVQKAFVDATKAGGKFYGMSEASASTINGQLSMLEDAWDNLFNTLGKGIEGNVVDIISIGTTLVEHYKEVAVVLGSVAAAYGMKKAAMITSMAIEKNSVLITQALTLAHKEGTMAAKTMALAQIQLKNTISAVGKAFAATAPYLALAAAVAFVGYQVYECVTYETELEQAQHRLNDAIGSGNAAADKEIVKLAQLSETLRLTSEGSDEYSNAKEGLLAIADKYEVSILNENGALDLSIEKYDKLKDAIRGVHAAKAEEAFKEEETKQLQVKIDDSTKSMQDELISEIIDDNDDLTTEQIGRKKAQIMAAISELRIGLQTGTVEVLGSMNRRTFKGLSKASENIIAEYKNNLTDLEAGWLVFTDKNVDNYSFRNLSFDQKLPSGEAADGRQWIEEYAAQLQREIQASKASIESADEAFSVQRASVENELEERINDIVKQGYSYAEAMTIAKNEAAQISRQVDATVDALTNPFASATEQTQIATDYLLDYTKEITEAGDRSADAVDAATNKIVTQKQEIKETTGLVKGLATGLAKAFADAMRLSGHAVTLDLDNMYKTTPEMATNNYLTTEIDKKNAELKKINDKISKSDNRSEREQLIRDKDKLDSEIAIFQKEYQRRMGEKYTKKTKPSSSTSKTINNDTSDLLAKLKEDNENRRVALLPDDREKKLVQIRKEEEQRLKEIEAIRQKFIKNSKNKQLTEEQSVSLSGAEKMARQKRIAAEEQVDKELLNAYAGYEQQKAAINEKYENQRLQILKAKADAELLINKKTEIVSDTSGKYSNEDKIVAQTDIDNAKTKVGDLNAAIIKATEMQSKETYNLDWQQFQGTDYYAMIFQDLSNYSTTTLKQMQEQLSQFGQQIPKDLNPEDATEFYNALEKVNDALIKEDWWNQLKSYKLEQAEIFKELSIAQTEFNNADSEYKTSLEQEENLQREINSIDDPKVKAEKETELAIAHEKTKVALSNKNKAYTKLINAENKAHKQENKIIKAQKEVTNQVDELAGSISNLGGSIEGTAGDILVCIADVMKFVTTSIDGMNKVSETGSTAIKAVETASVILGIITAAIALIKKLTSLVDSKDEKYEAAAAKQAEINKITDAVHDYKKAVIEAAKEEANWFAGTSMNALSYQYEEGANALDAYYGKANEMQEKYQNKQGGGFFVKAMAAATKYLKYIDPVSSGIAGAANKKLNDGYSLDYKSSKVSAVDNLRVETRAAKKGFIGIGSKNQKTEDLRTYVKKELGQDLFDASGMIDTELANTVMDTYGDKLVEETKYTLDNLVRYAEEYKEWQTNLKSYVSDLYSGVSDVMVDSIFNWLDTGEDALETFKQNAGDTFRSIAKEMIKTLANNLIFKDYSEQLTTLYEQYAKGGISENSLMQQVVTLTNGVTAKAEKVLPSLESSLSVMNDSFEAIGINIKDTNTEEQTASTAGGFETMSEDTGTELSGRFTSLYESNLRLEVAMSDISNNIITQLGYSTTFISAVSDAKGIMANSYLELVAIKEAVQETFKSIKIMTIDVKNIDRNIGNL